MNKTDDKEYRVVSGERRKCKAKAISLAKQCNEPIKAKQIRPDVTGVKRGKKRASKPRLVLVWLLIG